ncbi:hypothetical protein KIM372_11470 [Bombiscardovia nodaiensis]|uniref:Glycosyl hydrolase n=1 Tax=Bombiscardovia nodaiensis TaxID=2932181 RepID=A0ABM8B8S8_9BIFI|nr:hypothetical protein KIM372_11470 [Bombiscardovia nodaiensis]
MKFGVNYTPSQGWFYMWLHPDWDTVHRDMDHIASLGVDHVRIFPLWPILQPNRTAINTSGLKDLHRMVGVAGKAGLDCYVDVLQGHMSSFDFLPSWMLSWHKKNMFTDPAAVQAQAELVAAVYDDLHDLSCFAGLTLGNECNQFAGSSHPSPMRASNEDIEAWLRELLKPVTKRAHQDGRVVLHCENDEVWYSDGHPFLPEYAANIGDITAIHSWVFNGTAQHYGDLSQESVRHAEYLVQLAQAFANYADRKVWVQEIGAPLNVIAPEHAAQFCRESIEHILDSNNVYGLTWWCSHNVDQRYADFPTLEHELGLFDVDGKLTPIGYSFKEVVRQYQNPCKVEARPQALVIDTDSEGLPILRASLSPGGSVFDRWMELSAAGERPSLVLSKDLADHRLLEERGIGSHHSVEPKAGKLYSSVSDSSVL